MGGPIMHSNVPRRPPDKPGSKRQKAGRNDLMRQAAFLQKRFNLTGAEARLVVHLARGISLKSSAKALGVGYETVRRHIKSAFSNTGTTDRQNYSLLSFAL